MISISSNLNLMIKAAEKASKSVIRDFGEVENLQNIGDMVDLISGKTVK